MEKQIFETEVGGKTLTATFSDLVDQANGSVMLRYGNTTVLATAVMSDRENTGAGYFPLSVEFEEKFYAAGAILGSRFMRREGRPSEEAVLSARVVDRTIRPLFEHHIRNDIQVVITVLSIDEDDPDVLAVNAASLALAVSDIPWNGPVSAVRIGLKKEDKSLVVNPIYEMRNTEDALSCELLACGKDGSINMIEVGASEIDEATVATMLEEARKIHDELQTFQKDIVAKIGKEKTTLPKPPVSEEMQTLFNEHIAPKMKETVFCGKPGKGSIHATKDAWMDLVSEHLPEEPATTANDLYEEAVDAEIHRGAIEEQKRADSRGLDEVRPLFAQAGGVSEMLHGSGIFYRGGTHIFSALTLAGPDGAQLIDTIEDPEKKKRFIHHYNFPPFSAGETGRVGGFNRRMIGHGALAEKALEPVIPSTEEFPYTIRLVSESMASNGSTSMGSVCGSALALMDGGVPITRPVAGIASGLMMHDHDNYTLLTDIQGPEDEHGDMDFKVAGTTEGITAIQMDVKVDGIPVGILTQALEKARLARLHILETMTAEISAPRPDISPRAPRIEVIKINPERIGMVIGSGGKTINKIKEDTLVDEITIEEDGTIFIIGKTDAALKARAIIESMTHEYKPGEEAEGEVVKIMDFGAFVKVNELTEGLVHVSEIAPFRIDNVGKVLKVGERVPVVVKEIDDQGRVNLSIKRRDPDFAARKGIKPPESKES